MDSEVIKAAIQEGPTNWPSILSVLAIIISGIAVFVSIKFNRKSFTLQILNNLFNEYRSVEMFKAIKELHHFFRKECQGCTEKMINKYVERFWKEETNERQEDTLHFMRRLVSHYYQTAAMIYFSHILPKKWWLNIKLTLDVGIIQDILKPLETEAVGQCVYTKKEPGGQPDKSKPYTPPQVELMERFYKAIIKLK